MSYIHQLVQDMRLELTQWLDVKVVNQLDGKEVLQLHQHKNPQGEALLKKEYWVDTEEYIKIVKRAKKASEIILK